MSRDTWKKNKVNNQWVKTTLRIWSNVRKELGLPTSISRAMKIAYNTDFLPSKLGTGFKKWQQNGLVMLDQLFDGGVLMSYEQLRQKYNLPAHDFFKYRQLRHYLQKHKEWDKLCTLPSNIEHVFILVIKGTIKKKVISHLYRILQGELADNSLDIKEKWELEMNTIIPDVNWKLSCREGHKITNSPLWKEFEWKIKMTFFRTYIKMYGYFK